MSPYRVFAQGESSRASPPQRIETAPIGRCRIGGWLDHHASSERGERTVTIRFHRSRSVGEEHLLRIGGDHCETLICRPPGTVIGERNRSRSVQPRQRRWRPKKAFRSEYGRVTISTSGTTLTRAIFQKGVCGKCSRQKVCQRMIVLSSAPKRAESSQIRRGDGPCRMAVTRMTMTPEIDLSPEEAYRRRCDSLPAAVAIAAETQSLALLLGKLGGGAAAFVSSWPSAGTAARTCVLTSRFRQVLVDCEEDGPESGARGNS